mmetsp:Transcript_33283/g.48149  ORF Transcript_33283/g.48149 Transcript_33283/m.48149 type:complete len:179 (-) Transcript_33283:129-665(-)|eukprot:CAMPEP_0116029984 /NCGR_PEP_ID=MMETSP0321-20121206/16538_1 /TAXON_ID=163516 /ORGANISM="Leptocylindrus danicus var. danicus, Strain B650" /LENGTH=178 /DNA_ID=CAMNT_0003504611 /DNA_START=33 /DNA_END=569 /DNA_ORIENTATION=+
MKAGIFLTFLFSTSTTSAWSPVSRREVFSEATKIVSAVTVGAAALNPTNANAVQMYNTAKGVKYAITKDVKNANYPQPGDFVVVDYTGYKVNGQIFDATHSEGKSNALLFKLGSGSVIPGLEDVVSQMAIGQKVQAIIPPSLAYGDKGVCIENGECLIKPGETLVYDIYLVKSSIPPP